MKRYFINKDQLITVDIENNLYTHEYMFNSTLTAVYDSNSTKSIFDVGWKNMKDFINHFKLFSYTEIEEPGITTWINPNTNEEFKKYIIN